MDMKYNKGHNLELGVIYVERNKEILRGGYAEWEKSK